MCLLCLQNDGCEQFLVITQYWNKRDCLPTPALLQSESQQPPALIYNLPGQEPHLFPLSFSSGPEEYISFKCWSEGEGIEVRDVTSLTKMPK